MIVWPGAGGARSSGCSSTMRSRERWCLVHATHMNDDETDALARSGSVAGLCPTTEANLGDGLFPLARYVASQGSFGVGSDSNVSVSAHRRATLA